MTTAPPADAVTCTPCGTLMVSAGCLAKCLNCGASQPRGEYAEFVRTIARSVGMSPSDTPSAVATRVREDHAELTSLRPAVAAFYAAAKGLPSHIAVRPVCKAPLCDNLPRTNGLCNRCYEATTKGESR